jgi:hypothetical protein
MVGLVLVRNRLMLKWSSKGFLIMIKCCVMVEGANSPLLCGHGEGNV